jgi:hypothetical protein
VIKLGSTTSWKASGTVCSGNTQCPKEVQVSVNNKKIMLTLFWDSQGPVLELQH